METRICNKCGVEKAFSEFSPKKGGLYGLNAQCKPCRYKYQRERLAKLSEDPEWRIKFRTYCRERNSAARAINPPAKPDKQLQVRAVQRSNKAHPDRHAAREAISYAMRRGKILKTPCWCGETKVEAHHPSYAKEDRLRVVFLCKRHHHEEHVRLRNEALLQSTQSCPT